MDFLDQFYFDNSIRAYLVVFIVVFVAFFIKRFLSRYIASLLYLIVIRGTGKIEKKLFIDLVVQPLERFILLLISVLAIERLSFPHDWIINIYRVTSKQILESILIGILLISFTTLLLRFIDFISIMMKGRQITLSPSDNQLVYFFKDFLKVIIIIVSILLVMKFCFGIHIGQLITGLSIVGAAMALAAKESLENLIASSIIFFDKPFLVGDRVKIHQSEGIVEKIGLRSTRVRSDDQTVIVIPNKQMVDCILDNFSMRGEVRNEIKLELQPDTTSEKLEFAICAVKGILQAAIPDKTSNNVFLTEITGRGAIIIAEYFTPFENVNARSK